MLQFLPFETVRDAPGLRMVLVRGMPSPWSQAAKAILEVKGLDYVAAGWEPFEDNPAIRSWSGEASAPVIVWNGEKPVNRWIDVLMLAERLAPDVSLLPPLATDRALMIGLSHEICGEGGLGWTSRIATMAPFFNPSTPEAPMTRFVLKYGYDDHVAERSSDRIVKILRMLDNQLESQRALGRDWFVGEKLSALDIYWTAFSNALLPMPEPHLELPAEARAMLTATDPLVLAALTPALRAHRERIFRGYFRDPMEM